MFMSSQVVYIYHIHSLDADKILWLDYVVVIDLFDVVFVQFDLIKGHP